MTRSDDDPVWLSKHTSALVRAKNGNQDDMGRRRAVKLGIESQHLRYG
jgi:hypothetical protein